ncbi:hypothetical protein MTO96_027709 [Rhipicephalus appendiculatus]
MKGKSLFGRKCNAKKEQEAKEGLDPVRVKAVIDAEPPGKDAPPGRPRGETASSRTAPHTVRRRRGPTRRGRRRGGIDAAYTPRHFMAAHLCPHHHPARPPRKAPNNWTSRGSRPRRLGAAVIATRRPARMAWNPRSRISLRGPGAGKKGPAWELPRPASTAFSRAELSKTRTGGRTGPAFRCLRLCECGAVVVHSSHELGKLHRRRTEVTVPPSRETSQDPPQRRGQGHDVAGNPGGGFRPVAPDGGLRPCGRRESARRTASGRHFSGGGGASGGEDWRGRPPKKTGQRRGWRRRKRHWGAVATSAGAPAAHTAEPRQPEGMELDQALLVLLESE